MFAGGDTAIPIDGYWSIATDADRVIKPISGRYWELHALPLLLDLLPPVKPGQASRRGRCPHPEQSL
jgi:hypothetical protein